MKVYVVEWFQSYAGWWILDSVYASRESAENAANGASGGYLWRVREVEVRQ